MSHALINAPSEAIDDETEVPDVKPEIVRFDRYYAAEVEIVRGGSGREVTAYAAVYDDPSEIRDVHGHYYEVIDRSAFKRTLAHGIDRIGLYYNHAMHIDGTPSALGGVPLGSFLEISSDSKGLLTRARYNKTPLAESVLEAIKAGDIKGYSFRGRVLKSDPDRVPRIQRGGTLPTIYRREIALAEAGPTPSPFYVGASVVAVRSAAVVQALTDLRTLPLRERIEVIARAFDAEPVEPEPLDPQTPDSTPEPDDVSTPDTPDVPEDGTTTPVTPDPESEEDNEAADPTGDSPTDSHESLGTEGSPEEAPLPVETARARVADFRRQAAIWRISGGGN